MQRTALDIHLIEKPRDKPAAPADGLGPKLLFMLHVINERFDLLRPGSARSGSLLQTSQEPKPSDGKSKEAAMVGRFAFHLVASHGLSRPVSQSKHLYDHEKFTGSPLQGVSATVLVRDMRQVSKTFLHQGACAVTRQCKRMREKLIEHSRTSGENRETEHSPHSVTQNYVAQKMIATLKYRRRNELGHITDYATENPPYGQQTALWLDRLSQHANGIALVFARTETAMFFEHVWGKVAGALFLEGRLYFYQADGTRAKGNSGGPSVLLAYGEENAQLLQDCPLKGAYCTTIERQR